jgi:PilZ domain
VSVKVRVVQDRRVVSRVVTQMECNCIIEGESHQAKVINLSLKGASLSSKFRPPKDSDVKLALKTSLVKKTLTMEGKIVRVSNAMSEQGYKYRFGVRFNYSPLELVELINKLILQPKSYAGF